MLNIAPVRPPDPVLSKATADKLLFGGNGFNEGRTFVEDRARWRFAAPVCVAFAVVVASALVLAW